MQIKRRFESRYARTAPMHSVKQHFNNTSVAAKITPEEYLVDAERPIARDEAERLILEAHGAKPVSVDSLDKPEWMRKGEFAPPPERVVMDSGNFVANAGPLLTPENINTIPSEAEDTPEERQRLLELLSDDKNLSGLSGYALLDGFRIPPATLEHAIIEKQVARAERGWGLGRKMGGPW